MASWQIILALVMAAGVAVIMFGALWDRDRNARRSAALAAPPDRVIPGLESAEAPSYLSEAQARRTPEGSAREPLTAALRNQLEAAKHTATQVQAGWTSRDFITDPETGWAVLRDPTVLVAAERLVSLRELLPVLQHVHERGLPLVVVTPGIDATLQRTLEVNHLQGHLDLVVVEASTDLLPGIADAAGTEPLKRVDLQSGWLPPTALGQVGCWISDRRSSWILRVNPETSPTT